MIYRMHRMADYTDLSEELWIHISSLMSTKEWAKASGACTALWQLQPECIKARVPLKTSTADALTWLIKHWDDATSIDFSKVYEGGDVIFRVALATRASSSGVQKVLRVWASRSAPEMLSSDRILGSLLERATRLTCLKFSAKSDPACLNMAHLTRLKHLVLDICTFKSGLQWALQQLPCLETLHMGICHSFSL